MDGLDVLAVKLQAMNTDLEFVTGREAMIAAIEDMTRKFESGEIAAVSLRLFMADGTWEDVALGENAEDREAIMKMQRAEYTAAN